METEEWQKFFRTGKVEDYLAYREKTSNISGCDTGMKGEKCNNHAGICSSDRNDFTGISHGRI